MKALAGFSTLTLGILATMSFDWRDAGVLLCLTGFCVIVSWIVEQVN